MTLARSLTSARLRLLVAVVAAGTLGAGVSAALRPPDPSETPVPVAHSRTASQPSVPSASAPVAPANAQQLNQSIKATFVSATTDSVTVEGLGTVQGIPDVVVVNLAVSVTRDTSGKAMDASNAVVRKLLSSLHHHGVAAADIQSTGLSLYPSYEYHENAPPTLTGYQAGQSVTAKLRSAKTRGATIGAATAVSPGDVTVNGLAFDLEHDAAYLTRAQDSAFAAAKKRASQYAHLAGRRLGRVMTINEVTTPGAGGPVSYPASGGLGAAPASDVPLAAGSQGVSVSVTVTWALR